MKTEVKKTAIDLLPTILGIGAAILGIVIFKNEKAIPMLPVATKPGVSNTTITTNNYFFQSLSEEAIRTIVEDK